MWSKFKPMLVQYYLVVLIGSLVATELSANQPGPSNDFETFESQSLEIKEPVNSAPFNWQPQRNVNRQREDQLREARAFVNQLAAMRAFDNALAASSQPPETRRWRSAPALDSQQRDRRTLNNIMNSAGLAANTLDRLTAIESLFDDGNSSRLSRAYKPKTMSTARGFGKRSKWLLA